MKDFYWATWLVLQVALVSAIELSMKGTLCDATTNFLFLTTVSWIISYPLGLFFEEIFLDVVSTFLRDVFFDRQGVLSTEEPRYSLNHQSKLALLVLALGITKKIWQYYGHYQQALSFKSNPPLETVVLSGIDGVRFSITSFLNKAIAYFVQQTDSCVDALATGFGAWIQSALDGHTTSSTRRFMTTENEPHPPPPPPPPPPKGWHHPPGYYYPGSRGIPFDPSSMEQRQPRWYTPPKEERAGYSWSPWDYTSVKTQMLLQEAVKNNYYNIDRYQRLHDGVLEIERSRRAAIAYRHQDEINRICRLRLAENLRRYGSPEQKRMASRPLAKLREQRDTSALMRITADSTSPKASPFETTSCTKEVTSGSNIMLSNEESNSQGFGATALLRDPVKDTVIARSLITSVSPNALIQASSPIGPKHPRMLTLPKAPETILKDPLSANIATSTSSIARPHVSAFTPSFTPPLNTTLELPKAAATSITDPATTSQSNAYIDQHGPVNPSGQATSNLSNERILPSSASGSINQPPTTPIMAFAQILAPPDLATPAEPILLFHFEVTGSTLLEDLRSGGRILHGPRLDWRARDISASTPPSPTGIYSDSDIYHPPTDDDMAGVSDYDLDQDGEDEDGAEHTGGNSVQGELEEPNDSAKQKVATKNVAGTEAVTEYPTANGVEPPTAEQITARNGRLPDIGDALRRGGSNSYGQGKQAITPVGTNVEQDIQMKKPGKSAGELMVLNRSVQVKAEASEDEDSDWETVQGDDSN